MNEDSKVGAPGTRLYRMRQEEIKRTQAASAQESTLVIVIFVIILLLFAIVVLIANSGLTGTQIITYTVLGGLGLTFLGSIIVATPIGSLMIFLGIGLVLIGNALGLDFLGVIALVTWFLGIQMASFELQHERTRIRRGFWRTPSATEKRRGINYDATKVN